MESSPVLNMTFHYMAMRYMEPISTDDLAEASGVSRFMLSRMIKRAFNLTPMGLLWRLRVEIARDLLTRYPQMSCSDIAYAVGFETPPHFCRMFREIVGQTPGVFRLANRHSIPDGASARAGF